MSGEFLRLGEVCGSQTTLARIFGVPQPLIRQGIGEARNAGLSGILLERAKRRLFFSRLLPADYTDPVLDPASHPPPPSEDKSLNCLFLQLYEARASPTALVRVFGVSLRLIKQGLADARDAGLRGVLLERAERRLFFARLLPADYIDPILDPGSRPQPFSEQEKAEMNAAFLRLYEAVKTQRALAALCGVSQPAVNRQLDQARDPEKGIGGHVEG